MAKKKEVEVVNEVPKLTAEQYWEWRNACTEIWNANNKVKISELEAKVLVRDAEIILVQQKLHAATKIRTAKEEALNCSQEYQKLKGLIEEKLGVSLNNKVIDDITFEVRDEPKD